MLREVRASHILVKTEDEAKKLLEEIKAGKSFGDAAKEVSFNVNPQEGENNA